MWKTPGHFWAQIGPFAHILPSKRADIHCAAMDLILFRKPYEVRDRELVVLVVVAVGKRASNAVYRQADQR
jgi:hypothetical protein